ncbi:hypothetical protein C7271_19635 [filamentous cyanobacterium CCP5]|nr:hypothetical protein C7271_19635 [filamentous cyanobacterium CCP5]
MQNRCQSCRWIVAKVGVLLLALTGILFVCADLQVAANDRARRAEILQRIFFLNVIQKLEEP